MKRLKNEMDFSEDIIAKQYNEKNSLKRTTIILSFLCVISFAVNYILSITVGYLKFNSFPVLFLVSLGIITVCAILIPFIIGGHFLGGTKSVILAGNKDKKRPLEIFLVTIFGFGACITVNFISLILSKIILGADKSNSIHSYGNNIEMIVLMLVIFAILPAICEEVAFRGVVMGALRKYGDKVAIVISSLMFALLHNSLSSIIFAFCSGLILGFVRKSANLITPSIIIHFLNNAVGVIMSVLSGIVTIDMYILIYYTVVAVSFVLCVGSLIVLNRHKFGLFTISQHESVLDEREKFITALKNIFLYFIVFVFAVFILMSLLF